MFWDLHTDVYCFWENCGLVRLTHCLPRIRFGAFKFQKLGQCGFCITYSECHDIFDTTIVTLFPSWWMCSTVMYKTFWKSIHILPKILSILLQFPLSMKMTCSKWPSKLHRCFPKIQSVCNQLIDADDSTPNHTLQGFFLESLMKIWWKNLPEKFSD